MDAIIRSLLEQGVPSLVLAFAEPFFHAFIIYFFMCKLLPNRLNVYALIVMALVYALWFNLRVPELFGTRYHLLMNVFINAYTYFIVIILFRGKFWKNAIVWWYFEIIQTLCQAVAYVPVLLYHAGNDFNGQWTRVVSSVETELSLKLLHLGTFIPLFLLMGFLSLVIWRGILMQKFHPFYLLFFALPMGQVYSLSRVIQPSMGDWFFGILSIFVRDVETAYHILALFGLSIGIAASIATLYYIFTQEKRTVIEAELRETKREMELEQTRYGEMERRSEEMAKIRHDFNNQLASIIELVKVGEDSTAQKIITTLSGEINQEWNT
jgi:hypothetical protein